jgi:hypothetical protein
MKGVVQMNSEERARLIDQYEQGYAEVMAAIAGIDEDGLAVREAPEEWSVREIIHHLGDSEMAAAFTLRLILAQDEPVLQGYDHEAFARVLHRDMPIDPALAAFAGARAATLPMLRSMSDEDWQRAGLLGNDGRLTAETWLSWYGGHAHDHADQIRRALAAR